MYGKILEEQCLWFDASYNSQWIDFYLSYMCITINKEHEINISYLVWAGMIQTCTTTDL